MNLKVTAETFDPHQLCFPIVAAKCNDSDFKNARFLGTSVLLNKKDNKILTCAHLHNYLQENESLCIIFHGTGKIFRLVDIRLHNSIDLMIASIQTTEPVVSRINFIDFIRDKPIEEFHLGLEVRAYGYTSESPNANPPTVIIEMRQGFVTLSTSNNERTKFLGANSRRELSFSCPSGMSGSPLLLAPKPGGHLIPIGILFNNIESSIAQWELSSVEENGSEYRESKLRIEEHALAHSLEDIEIALQQLL